MKTQNTHPPDCQVGLHFIAQHATDVVAEVAVVFGIERHACDDIVGEINLVMARHVLLCVGQVDERKNESCFFQIRSTKRKCTHTKRGLELVV